MKKCFLITIILTLVFTGNTQSLVLVYEGKELPSGTTLLLNTIDPLFGYMKADIAVKNTGDRTVSVRVRKTVKKKIPGSSNLFCWGTQCYAETADSSLTPVTIPAKSVNVSFYAEYVPAGRDTGRSIIEYEFYDVLTPLSTAKVTLHFVEIRTGLHDIGAGEILTFQKSGRWGSIRIASFLSSESTLFLHLISGEPAAVIKLPPGNSDILLSLKHNTCIYLYSLVRNNKTVRKGKFFAY